MSCGRRQPGAPLEPRGTSQLPLNTWTHLAATYDGTTLRLYVNGVQVGSSAVSGALLTSTGRCALAATASGASSSRAASTKSGSTTGRSPRPRSRRTWTPRFNPNSDVPIDERRHGCYAQATASTIRNRRHRRVRRAIDRHRGHPYPIGGASWSPPESGRPQGPISLHRNENAYGASRQAIAAVRQAALTLGQRTPNDERKQLREAIAARHGSRRITSC